MNDIFDFTSNTEGTHEGSTYPDIRNADWQPSGLDGFWIKPLLRSADDTVDTWLMKIDGGAYAPSHAHNRWEQVYVLDGSMYDQQCTLVAGDFVYRAPGTEHVTGSDNGALVLLVYSVAGPA